MWTTLSIEKNVRVVVSDLWEPVLEVYEAIDGFEPLRPVRRAESGET